MLVKLARKIFTPLVHDSARGVWTRNGVVVQTDAQFSNAQAAFFKFFVGFLFLAIAVGIFLIAW